MTFAVHNIHSPSVELFNGGYTHDGVATIKASAPIHEADTFEDAEAWRLAKLGERK